MVVFARVFLMFIQWLHVDEAAGEVHSFIAV
jgi:hypothetical protein